MAWNTVRLWHGPEIKSCYILHVLQSLPEDEDGLRPVFTWTCGDLLPPGWRLRINKAKAMLDPRASQLRSGGRASRRALKTRQHLAPSCQDDTGTRKPSAQKLCTNFSSTLALSSVRTKCELPSFAVRTVRPTTAYTLRSYIAPTQSAVSAASRHGLTGIGVAGRDSR